MSNYLHFEFKKTICDHEEVSSSQSSLIQNSTYHHLRSLGKSASNPKRFMLVCFMIWLLSLANLYGQANCTDVCTTPIPCYNVDLSDSPIFTSQVYVTGSGSCCSTIPVNQNCAQVSILLNENAEGIQVLFFDGPNQCSINVYEGIDCPTAAEIASGPSVCDPICPTEKVDNVVKILLCKPGNFNEIGFQFNSIAKPQIFPMPSISQSCNVALTAVNINPVTWSSVTDPILSNILSCPSPYTTCGNTINFVYNAQMYGEVTDCDGVVFDYSAMGVANSECSSGILSVTGGITVYPDFDIHIQVSCNANGDAVLNAIPIGNGASCSYVFEWLDLDENIVGTGPTLVVDNDGAQYCVNVRRVVDIDECAVVSKCALAECCKFTFECPTGSSDLGTYNCNQLLSIPALPVLVSEASAAPYAIVFGDNPCGIIRVRAVDSQPINICSSSDQSIQRTVYFYDDANNNNMIDGSEEEFSCVFNFTVIADVTSPVVPLVVPMDVTLDCPNQIPVPINLTAIDNCSGEITVSPMDIFMPLNPDLGCVGQKIMINRRWTFEDACGNISTSNQMITINALLSPEFNENVLPVDITLSCEAPIPTKAILTVTDNCNNILNVMCSEIRTDGNCTNNYTLTRTWSASTCSGLMVSHTQIITITDQTDPVITGTPAATTVSCATDVPLASINAVIATDNCSGSVIIAVNDVTALGSCDNRFSVTRTWTATDICNNSSTSSQIITVDDQAGPSITDGCNTDVQNLDCDATLPTIKVLANFTVTDACEGGVTLHSVVTNPSDGTSTNRCSVNDADRTVTRTYTFRDACNNETTCVETFVFAQDQTGPSIIDGCNTDVQNLDCDATLPTAKELDAFTIADDCAGMVTLHSVVTNPESGAPDNRCSDDVADRTVTRTYTFRDACSNETSCVETFVFAQDQTGPSITDGCTTTDQDLACDASLPAAKVLADFTIADDCAGMVTLHSVVTNPTSGTPDNICSDDAADRTVTRTYTFRDACDNETTCVETFVFAQQTAPIIISPRDVTISLNDNCQIPSSFNYGIPTVINGSCDNNPTVSAENIEECIGTIMSQNISARPEGHFIPIVVSGYDGLNASELEKITLSFSVNQGKGKAEFKLVAPNGSEVTLVGAQCSVGNCELNGDITYTPTFYGAGHLAWNNSDLIPAGVGNFIPYSGTFANLTGPMKGTWYIYGTKTNGPGNVTFERACLTIATQCPSNQNLIRVWTVTDNCGNTNQSFQNISLVDNTAPVAPTAPADITVNCPGDIPAPISLTATDNCSDPITVNPTDEFMGSLDDCNGQSILIKRTWTFTDACGNSSSVSQMITIDAVMNPAFNQTVLPADITVNCNEIPVKTMLTVNDNCGRILTVMCTQDEEIDNNSCSKRLIRRWSAQDCAGNEVSHTQTIIIRPGTLLTTYQCPQVTYSYNNAVALTLSDFNNINLDNGEDGYCTVNYVGRATVLDISNFTCSDGGTVVVTYRFTSPCDPTGFTQQCVHDVLPGNCMFTVQKSGVFNDENGDSNAQVGESITYTIRVINTGSEPVSDINVSDVLITNQSTSNTIDYASGDINTNDILDAGETWIYTATYIITSLEILVGEVENQVIVTGMNPDGEEEENDDFETVDLPSYIIEIDKMVLNDPNSFAPGDQVDFIIQVSNFSNLPLYNAVITDTYNATELTFDPTANFAADLGNDNEWIINSPGSISTTIDFIPAGGLGFVFVNFGIPRTFMGETIINNASVVSFEDEEGNSTSDPDGPIVELPEDDADVIVDQDPAILCVEATIVQQPRDLNLCDETSGTLSIIATGPGLYYQWQIWNGTTFVDIAGQNSSSLVLLNITSGNRYKVLVYTNRGTIDECFVTSSEVRVVLGGNLNYACNDLVNISLDETCMAVITPDMILEGDTENNQFEVAIFVNGVNIGNTINNTHLDKILEVRVYHKCSGNYCWGKIFVEDKLPPVITCPVDYTVSCLNIGFNIPIPSFRDACDPTATIRVTSNVLVELACDHPSGFRAVRTLTYVAQDRFGNISAPCTFKVNYQAIDVETTVWPLNLELACEPIVWDRNGNSYPDPIETGFPKIANIDLAKAVANNPKAVTSDNYCRVNVTFADIIIPLCNPTYKITREWVVLDWCSGDIVRHNQFIKLIDQGVVVSCPPVQTIYADHYSCTADWTVLQPSLQIKCSPTTWTVAFKKGDGSLIPPSDNVPFVTSEGLTQVTGTYPNFKIVGLPAGRTWIRYTFKNECGFEIFCTTEVDVIDQVKPTPVCDETTVVSLSSNGASRIYAKSVDDGSHDNCSEVTFAIRRMTNNCALSADAKVIATFQGFDYYEFVDFCCLDQVQNKQQVELLVIDAAGNKNVCMTNIEIQQKALPILTIPADRTVDCEVGTSPQQLNETATFTSSCNLYYIDFSDNLTEGDCGAKTILRTWQIKENGTNKVVVSKVQTIRVRNLTPFDLNNVVFPAHQTLVNKCQDAKDFGPDNPATGGYPTWVNTGCSQIAVSYQDQVFSEVDDACFKIIRHWAVLDWCTFDANNPSTTRTYQQVIKVIDTEKPTPQCPAIVEDVTMSGCSKQVTFMGAATDPCTPDELLKFSYTLNGGTRVNARQFNNTLNVGSHNVVWTVSDRCGNSTTCLQTIQVRDVKKPTPYCLSELTTVIMPSSGNVSIWAKDYDRGSTDNCSTNLKFSSSAIFPTTPAQEGWTFTCADFPTGKDTIHRSLRMYVWDEAKNFDFCTVKIIIQKNTACGGTTNPMKIAGNVFNVKNDRIGNVKVDITNQENFEFNSVMTTAAGSYQFHDMSRDDYMIKPEKNDDYLNGVTTLDLVLIQRHILGLQPFIDPYKFFAADINKDGKISASDLVELRKLILGIHNDFPKNTSWRFFDAKMDPSATSFPNGLNEFIMLADAATNMENNDFIGVKIGDVNQSALTNVNGEFIENRTNNIWLQVDNANVEVGKTVSIPVKTTQNLLAKGFQTSIKISENDVRFVKLISDVIDLKSEHYHFDNSTGILNISWNQKDDINLRNGVTLFEIVLESHTKSSIDQIIKLDQKSVISEYYTNDLSSVKFGLEFMQVVAKQLTVFQNQPNPFVHSTLIPFELPYEGLVKIKIYDTVGKVVFERENHYISGAHQFEVTESMAGDASILYFEIVFDGQSTTKKMIHLR